MFSIYDWITSLAGNQCAFCGERVETFESPCQSCIRILSEKTKSRFLTNHFPSVSGNLIVYSTFEYDDDLKRMIIQNKRSPHRSFTFFFASELIKKIPEEIWRDRVIVPVPGSAFQETHLVESLTESLCAKGIAAESLLVRNLLYKGSQKKLGNRERRSIQIDKQFKLLDKKIDKEIILLDDVCTTGSTLKSLKKLIEATCDAKVHCGLTLAYTEKIL